MLEMKKKPLYLMTSAWLFQRVVESESGAKQ